ncbi:MAG TPA: ion transporter [Methanoregulaceae archaeon]|jgi:voltage-gated potassium channel|nr:ion transporter [Methanoregulaceae archaeon]
MTLLAARKALHAFLEEDYPRGFGKKLFRSFMYALISVNILLIVLETAPDITPATTGISTTIYFFSICIFIVLYILRLWVCVEDSRFAKPLTGRLRYMVTPYAVVDLLVLIAFTTPVSFMRDPLVYEVIRFLRLSIILKLIRYSDSLRTMTRIFISKRKPLGMALYMLLFLLLITSTMMFLVEHAAQPDKFSSVAESMWWGIETLTTLGYGDIVPVTPAGKLLGGFVALLGIGMFAIPAGILASGFYEEYAREEEKEAKTQQLAAGEETENQSVCPTCGHPMNRSGQA